MPDHNLEEKTIHEIKESIEDIFLKDLRDFITNNLSELHGKTLEAINPMKANIKGIKEEMPGKVLECIKDSKDIADNLTESLEIKVKEDFETIQKTVTDCSDQVNKSIVNCFMDLSNSLKTENEQMKRKIIVLEILAVANLLLMLLNIILLMV